MERKTSYFFNFVAAKLRDLAKVEQFNIALLIFVVAEVISATTLICIKSWENFLTYFGSSLLISAPIAFFIFFVLKRQISHVKSKIRFIPEKVLTKNPWLKLYKIEGEELIETPTCGYFTLEEIPETEIGDWYEKKENFIVVDLGWEKKELVYESHYNQLKISIKFSIKKPQEFKPTIELVKKLIKSNQSLGDYVKEKTEQLMKTENNATIEELVAQYISGQILNEMEFRYRLNLLFARNNRIELIGEIADLEFQKDWLEIKPAK